jgi:hypothetical protein
VAPLDAPGTEALARWGIEIHAGWRAIMERLLQRLEAEIAALPTDPRDRFRIVQIKEKFGRLTVYLESEATPEMRAALQDAEEMSIATCEVCRAPGRLAERKAWWAARCVADESWTPTKSWTHVHFISHKAVPASLLRVPAGRLVGFETPRPRSGAQVGAAKVAGTRPGYRR